MNNILWFPKFYLWFKWCLIEISQWLNDVRRQMMIALDKCILSSWIWLSFELDFKLSIGLLSICQTQRVAGPRCGESCNKKYGWYQTLLLLAFRSLGVGWFCEEAWGHWWAGSAGAASTALPFAASGCDLGCEGCPRAAADLSVLTQLKRGCEIVDLS